MHSENRVAVVTGASSGIGKEAARSLLQRGWRVIGTGRNPERTETAEQELASFAPDPDQFTMLCGDLAHLAETRRIAGEIVGLTDRVDALLNNAGGLTAELVITPEGNENTFASNHLGHFLLTELLLPLLKKAAANSPAGATRIINVSSAAHLYCQGINWDDLQFKNNFNSGGAYCQVKLFNILFTRSLCQHLASEGIVSHAMHPGVVSSNFYSHGDDSFRNHLETTTSEVVSSEHAAKTLVWLASDAQPGKSCGGYYTDCELASVAPLAEDTDAAEKLWDISEQLVADFR